MFSGWEARDGMVDAFGRPIVRGIVKRAEYVQVGSPCGRCGSRDRYAEHGRCPHCASRRATAHSRANPQKANIRRRRWAEANPHANAEAKRQWKLNNPEACASQNRLDAKRRRDRYPAKKQAEVTARRCAQMKRTPPWADLEKIASVYADRYELSHMPFGGVFHVDHDIPLQGKRVSGLHVHTNLAIRPGRENLQKSNHFEVI